MSGLSRRAGLGRVIWTGFVTFYFLVFFYHLLTDALPGGALLPHLFAAVFVLWLGVEYYFGSPFFQSGVFEYSGLWRGVFAFFVYPFIGYAAADYIWWHRTQLPVPPVIAGVLGLLVFGAGTYGRVATLLGVVRIIQVRQTRDGKGKPVAEGFIPEKRLVVLPFQRVCRHPRYLATLVQLVGIALVFRSWGALALALGLGLPLVMLQARHEDRALRGALKADFEAYGSSVPLLFPRLRQ